MSTTPRPPALILSRPLVVGALAVGFLMIFGTALLTTWSTRGHAADDHRTVHTQHALTASTQFLIALSDTAAAAQGVVAGDDETNLDSYRALRDRTRAELATLAAHAEHAPLVRPVALQLHELTHAYLAGLDRATDSARATGPSAPSELDQRRHRQLTEEIRALIATLQRHLFLELARSSSASAHRADNVHLLNMTLVTLGGALAIGVTVWLLRRLRDLEGLITVCAWTRRVQWEGRWISFEEYLAKRFNLYCTHGICEEAAEKMRQEAANTPVPADFLR